jgi:hypothetical protein
MNCERSECRGGLLVLLLTDQTFHTATNCMDLGRQRSVQTTEEVLTGGTGN